MDCRNRTAFSPTSITTMLINNMPTGVIKLGTALRAVQGDQFRAMADRSREYAEMVQVAEQSRKEHLDGREMPPLVIPKGSPRWVTLTLLRYFIRDGKTIKPNDVADLFHACVPLTYAHAVTLDGAWANFASKLNLANTHVFTSKTFRDGLNVIRSLRTDGIKGR